jgi:3-hydroxyacyl-CoA dehydrogenase
MGIPPGALRPANCAGARWATRSDASRRAPEPGAWPHETSFDRSDMSTLVHLTRDADVAVVSIDNPPVNALSPAVIAALHSVCDQALADDSVRAVVIMGHGRTFVAGADIKEFVRLAAGPRAERKPVLAPLLSRLEEAQKPIVMALAGPVFGGGLELAMAGHYRVAEPDARLAQPEVKLGLIPGAGGTQRLPRLIGIEAALRLCAEGEPIDAAHAHALGLVDALSAHTLRDDAIAFARAVTAQPPQRTRERHERLGTPAAAAPLVAQARTRAQRRLPGQHAPLLVIEAVEAATRLPFDEGCRLEHELFTRCLFGDQARALMHVFFAEREAARIPDVPRETEPRAIERVGVVGAGTMGRGIAMTLANAGLVVLLTDTDPQALARALTTLRDDYARAAGRGTLTRAQADERLTRIQPVQDLAALASVDLVIEAVFEDLALKRALFEALDRHCRADAILATNTSTLDIDVLATATARPGSVVGLHFFNPAPVMRLVEVVRGRATQPAVLATCLRLAKRLGKLGVLVGNAPGFVANRMLRGYRREAQFLVEEGARPEAVDQALVDFGMALGPLAVGDLVGLDVAWSAAQQAPRPPAGLRQPFAETCLYEWGRHGRKCGAGWYLYDAAGVARPDAALLARLRAEARARGLEEREPSSEEIVARCLYAMINAGAHVLEQGLALRASDIDVVHVTGLGFPAWRGGPLWYADTLGLGHVHARIVEWQRAHGAWWEPAPLLTLLARDGLTFADYDRRAAARD